MTADTTAPSAPTGLAAHRSTGSTVNLSWTASTDDVAVVALQRPPRHHARLHAQRRQPDRAADRAQLRRQRPRDRQLLLQGHRRGRRRQHQRRLQRGHRHRRRRDPAQQPRHASPPPPPAARSTSAGAPPPTTSPSAATTSTAAPPAASPPAPPTGSRNRPGSATADTGLTPGTYFYKLTAEDAAGNIGPLSNTATATVADTTPPSTPTLTATGGAGQATLSWTAATDNVAVTRYNLHRSTTSGFTPTTANRIAQPTGTSYTDTGLAAGTYYYKLTAEDAAGNISPASNQATATVTAPPVTGLVAAYGFDAGTGTTVTDQSGTGNNGTLTNATWAGATAGKFGNALTFNGTNATVTIPDTTSLDLTTGMTLEAWVRPTGLGDGWRTVDPEGAHRLLRLRPVRERRRHRADGADRRRSSAAAIAAPRRDRRAAAQHLDAPRGHLRRHHAALCTSTASRPATLAVSGSIITSTGALKIGGNAIWGEWFKA